MIISYGDGRVEVDGIVYDASDVDPPRYDVDGVPVIPENDMGGFSYDENY